MIWKNEEEEAAGILDGMEGMRRRKLEGNWVVWRNDEEEIEGKL